MEDDSMQGPSGQPSVTKSKRKIHRKFPREVPEEEPHGNAKWSVTEKKKLLYAIKKFGWRNSDMLVATVETKTKEQIERFLVKKQKIWKRLSQIHFTGNVAPVEVWLEKAQKISVRKPFYARSLSKAFSMIGQDETFPRPKSPLDPNYPELYEYFAHLLQGNTPTALSEGNKRVVLSLLEMVASILKGAVWIDERQFFSQHSDDPPSQEGSSSRNENVNAASTSHASQASADSQMECDDGSKQLGGVKIKSEPSPEEVAKSPEGSRFEELKDLLFSDDAELATLNPFGLPFHMFTQASEKVEQLLLKQNLID